MKKLAKCMLCFASALILLAFGISVSAEDSPPEYLITQASQNYILSRYKNGTPIEVASGTELAELLTLCEGGAVTLDNITLSTSLTVNSKSLLLRGTLSTSHPIIMENGSDIAFDELNMETESYIRIKGGALNITDSNIISSTEAAIQMDYSSASRLDISDSVIKSESNYALKLISGIASIKDSKIISECSRAIYNSATLTLSGTTEIIGQAYDIITSEPIMLSNGKAPFSGTARIMWDGIFEKGNMYEIFRQTQQESLLNISLYDNMGREYDLTYFDECKHTDERSFAAVYLPYKLKFFDGADELFSEYYLKGEAPSEVSAPEKTGYGFVGWYTDSEKTKELSFSEPISSDISVFSSYKLMSPRFSLSSMSFTYDGEQRLFGFTMLTHPLDAVGYYTLEWYKNGVFIGTLESLSITETKDSGNYSCKITFHSGSDTVSLVTPEVNVTVNKRAVPIPQIPTKPYNGKLQYSDLSESAFYTVSDTGGIDAGEYLVMLSLKDSANHIFSGGSEGIVKVPFVITKCENSWVTEPSVNNYYQNSVINHSAHAAFGKVIFLYSNNMNGVYTENIPTEVGKYYCVARVEETDNYKALATEPMPFSVLAEIPLGLAINTPPDKTHYFAFDKFIPTGLTLKVTYNSGRTEIIGTNEIGIHYQRGEAFLYGDNAVSAAYLSLSLPISVSVQKRSYDISNIRFENTSLTYDGKYHEIAISGTLPVGLDGIPLSAQVSTGAVDSGKYTLTLTFSSDSINYILPENKTALLTIMPFSADVIWENLSFVYDGTPKLPRAYYINVDGIRMPLSVSGSAVNAGDSIGAAASTEDKNYLLNNPTASFKILKADISFLNAVWSADSFIYSNQAHIVTVSGLPNGVSVIGYTDNTAKNAGKYTATAILSYDEQNFNPPPPLTHSWTIEKADYDTSGFEFSGGSYVYDGTPHYPTLLGNMPIGLDGIPLSYSFSKGVTDAASDAVKVSVIFSTDSLNYNLPPSLQLGITVTPMPISVLWSYNTAVYNGLPHAPTALTPYTVLNVSGAMINAGIYTATAAPVSTNYTLINPTFTFEIAKAENSWKKHPEVKDIYSSSNPSPTAIAENGKAIFYYFTDEACTQEVSLPLSHGVYYMQSIVPESQNYNELLSAPMRFVVKEVLPISLDVIVVSDKLIAFNRLSNSDISISVTNNDGTVIHPSIDELTVLYQRADSLRAMDSAVTLMYMSLEKSIDISVSKAKFNTSGVVWKNTEGVFNNEYQVPTLSGLPQGVSVKEYIGYGKDAGEYTASAVLEYDKENYDEPVISPTKLVIKKQVLPIPSIPNETYDSDLKNITIDKSLYTTDFNGAVSAGKYNVTLTLSDSKNYIFENGAEKLITEFNILPKSIKLDIAIPTVYLWQEPFMPSISIVDSDISEEDLLLYFEMDGDTMIIKSQNPNYVLTESSVIIKRISRPAPETSWLIIIVVLILLCLVLLTVAVYLNREKIKDAMAKRRCRRSFSKEILILNEAKAADIPLEKLDINPDITPDTVFAVDVERADSLISDNLAKNLIKNEKETVYTDGKRKCVINIDTVSENFTGGETVDVNKLKDKLLVPSDSGYVKILARGSIDKALTVKANAFSISAVKMIALSGGEAIKVTTQSKNR